ncbi:ComGF family competence protein [Ligilactobacillus faecis]|uniref:ComGF family competence protein n=1 Tax=Ligilactobacillus faecis TaxID=762833 RepID=A0ABV4DNU2_9LACO
MLKCISKRVHLSIYLKTKAFTLSEAVVALFICALGFYWLLDLSNVLHQERHADERADRFEWERLVSYLNSEKARFVIDRVGEHDFIYSELSQKHYELHQKDERLIMSTVEGGGYMPLLYGVTAFSYQIDKNTLILHVKIHQVHYETKIFLKRNLSS